MGRMADGRFACKSDEYFDKHTGNCDPYGRFACKSDEYFDKHTGNCDPCKPLCDMSDCTQHCPNYTTPTTTSTSDVPVSQYDTATICLIIGLVLLFVFVVIIVTRLLYKRYCKNTCMRFQNKIPQAGTPIQETGDLQESIALTIDAND